MTLKYLTSDVTFLEFPDEISLCINISGCPNKCEGCHSPELWEDKGALLNINNLESLIEHNEGITCIGLMGGDQDPGEINSLAAYIKESHPTLKVGWYSGKDKLPEEIELKNFNYIKLGPYIKSLGGLTNPKSNQNFYEIRDIGVGYVLHNVTNKFIRKNV